MFANAAQRPDEEASIRLRQLYQRHGYSPYRMSKFETYDLYVRNKSFLVSENILTFTDTDGRLMAMKPDVTLSIVKNTPDTGETPQKVYYTENVYRAADPSAGYREIMQTGLECIGPLDSFAVGEVLALAAESLALIRPDYLLDLSHMGFASSLLDGLEEALRLELLAEIGRKNLPAIQALCEQAGIAPDRARQIGELALLYGPPQEVLPRLEAMVLDGRMAAALDELRQLIEFLERLDLGGNLRLDFSVVNDMRYYNGIIFRGYLPGLASGVLAGGRYDNLLARMGKRGGAIGFAMYLDQLERLETAQPDFDGDILLLYSESDDAAQVARRAQALLEQGRNVRVERSAPQGLRFRETIRFGEEG